MTKMIKRMKIHHLHNNLLHLDVAKDKSKSQRAAMTAKTILCQLRMGSHVLSQIAPRVKSCRKMAPARLVLMASQLLMMDGTAEHLRL